MKLDFSRQQKSLNFLNTYEFWQNWASFQQLFFVKFQIDNVDLFFHLARKIYQLHANRHVSNIFWLRPIQALSLLTTITSCLCAFQKKTLCCGTVSERGKFSLCHQHKSIAKWPFNQNKNSRCKFSDAKKFPNDAKSNFFIFVLISRENFLFTDFFLNIWKFANK